MLETHFTLTVLLTAVLHLNNRHSHFPCQGHFTPVIPHTWSDEDLLASHATTVTLNQPPHYFSTYTNYLSHDLCHWPTDYIYIGQNICGQNPHCKCDQPCQPRPRIVPRLSTTHSLPCTFLGSSAVFRVAAI